MPPDPTPKVYQPRILSRSDFHNIRGIRQHVRVWGNTNAPKLFLCHGWMDSSASFQFLVDALQSDWQIIAPDWRGFGLSDHTRSDTYYFPDYFADLDAIINQYEPDTTQAIRLIGHSMGGNIVNVYAGIRPERISRLINIEGFGLPPTKDEDAPEHFAGWLDKIQHGFELRTYPNFTALAQRLQKRNATLSDDKAEFLARHWGYVDNDGHVRLHADPWHKNRNPVQYRADEMAACWRRIAAPTLTIIGKNSEYTQWVASEIVQERLKLVTDNKTVTVEDAGHMLHFDCPELLAQLIEDFLR